MSTHTPDPAYYRTRSIVRTAWMIAALPIAYCIGYVW